MGAVESSDISVGGWVVSGRHLAAHPNLLFALIIYHSRSLALDGYRMRAIGWSLIGGSLSHGLYYGFCFWCHRFLPHKIRALQLNLDRGPDFRRDLELFDLSHLAGLNATARAACIWPPLAKLDDRMQTFSPPISPVQVAYRELIEQRSNSNGVRKAAVDSLRRIFPTPDDQWAAMRDESAFFRYEITTAALISIALIGLIFFWRPSKRY